MFKLGGGNKHISVAKVERTLGLYSAFLACIAIVFRSNLIPKFTVATMFLKTTDTGVRMG